MLPTKTRWTQKEDVRGGASSACARCRVPPSPSSRPAPSRISGVCYDKPKQVAKVASSSTATQHCIPVTYLGTTALQRGRESTLGKITAVAKAARLHVQNHLAAISPPNLGSGKCATLHCIHHVPSIRTQTSRLRLTLLNLHMRALTCFVQPQQRHCAMSRALGRLTDAFLNEALADCHLCLSSLQAMLWL